MRAVEFCDVSPDHVLSNNNLRNPQTAGALQHSRLISRFSTSPCLQNSATARLEKSISNIARHAMPARSSAHRQRVRVPQHRGNLLHDRQSPFIQHRDCDQRSPFIQHRCNLIDHSLSSNLSSGKVLLNLETQIPDVRGSGINSSSQFIQHRTDDSQSCFIQHRVDSHPRFIQNMVLSTDPINPKSASSLLVDQLKSTSCHPSSTSSSSRLTRARHKIVSIVEDKSQTHRPY